MILEHLDKKNLHHAYLIEGTREEIVPIILKFSEELGVKSGSADFIHITVDGFKIDEAFNLRKMGAERSFSDGKKIFVLCVNSFSLDAQNVLLKMFEEPIENTHFFVIIPDANTLLKTLISRFYFISTKGNLDLKNTEKFIKMTIPDRINFIKEFLTINEKDEDDVVLDSTRAKALNFLNALEVMLSKTDLDININCFEHLFKVREFLRMPGSSTKTLLESMALVVPNFKN